MKHYILSIMEARGVSASITPAGSGDVDSTFGVTDGQDFAPGVRPVTVGRGISGRHSRQCRAQEQINTSRKAG